MPSTINGIGTWYYGKRNVYTSHDQCEYCHNWSDLRSYDTTKYFVVVFVPIIPLGSFRVLNECPRCTRHYSMKLKEWEALKREKIGEAASAFRDDPANEQNAIDAVVAVVRFQDPKSFERLAGVLKQHHPHNASVQRHLAGAYEEFGDLPAAEGAFRASLAAEDTESMREGLAVVLIRQQRPAEAAPYVEHVLKQKDVSKVALLLAQAQGFQAVGEHESALDVLKHIEETFQDVAEDKEFTKIRKLSAKRLGTRKKVKVPALQGTKQRRAAGGERAPILPRIIGPALGVLIATIYLSVAYVMGRNRDVWLVNGLERAYSVNIDGQIHKLPAKAALETSVGEGAKTIAIVDGDIDIPDQRCEIRTSFWLRPFLDRTFIVNPDRTALLLWEQARYSEDPAPDAESDYALHAGKALYEFRGIDYHFEDFPAEIQISEGSVARKERVSHLSDVAPLTAMQIIAGNSGMEQAVDYLANYASAVPTDATCVLTLSALMAPERFVEFAKPKLDVRPVLIEWHRMYQTGMEKSSPEDNLVAEYRGLHAKDPSNGDLAYLLARVIPDHDESEEVLTRVVRGDKPTAYAFGGLAMRRLAVAKFDEALALIEKSLELAPDTVSFGYVRDEALRGLRRYDALLAENAWACEQAPTDGNLVAERIRLLAAKGDKGEAAKLIDAFCDLLMEGDGQQADEWRSFLQAILSHSTGDTAAFARNARSLDGERWPFEIAVATGDWAVAQETFGTLTTKDVDDHLLLYAWAVAENADEAAKAHLDAAVGMLQEGDAGDRRMASFLSGATTPASTDAVLRMPHEVSRKRILLAAFGQRFPHQRSEYFALARQLNHRRQYPYLLLSRLLAQ